jgi:hypothetical protein
VVVMGTIIRRSVTPLNSSRTWRAVRGCETVCHIDDNSPWKVQNVRRGSSAVSAISIGRTRVVRVRTSCC